jgi:enterobactin synthetase component D / holo-[acyl-carrier protein] synthase
MIIEQANFATILQKILPATVASGEQIGMLSGSLLNEEITILGQNAAPRRKAEFAAGRTCGRQAMRVLGLPEMPILRGDDRQPLWPEGIVGSITHCDGYCAAAVGRATEFSAIGIDAENNEPLPANVLGAVAFGDELEWVHSLPPVGVCWDRLLFSIKEAVYKAWYPRERRWLDFDQVSVALDIETTTFEARISSVPASTVSVSVVYRGFYLMTESLILTSVCVPAAATCVW